MLVILLCLVTSTMTMTDVDELAALPRFRLEDHGEWGWASYGGQSPPSPALVGIVDSSLRLIRRQLGAREPKRVIIVYTPNRPAFRRAVGKLGGGEPAEFVLALAFPSRGIMVLDGDRFLLQPLIYLETIRHELAHLVLGAGGERVPRWYHEGVAQWLSGASVDWEMKNVLAYLARDDGLVPFSEMNVFPRAHRISSLYYRQSLAFVSYLSERYGADVHQRILEQLAAGESMEKAFHAATGEPLTVVERRWIDRIARDFSWFEVVVHSIGLFPILAVVVIVGFLFQSARRRRRLRQMAAEESQLHGE